MATTIPPPDVKWAYYHCLKEAFVKNWSREHHAGAGSGAAQPSKVAWRDFRDALRHRLNNCTKAEWHIFYEALRLAEQQQV